MFKFTTKKTKKFQTFLRKFYYPHPLLRLKPRTTIRGAYLEAFSLHWSQEKFPDESFFCLDVNGLYSFCAIKYPSFVGKYEILIGKNLSKVKLTNNLLFFENEKLQGTILVSILPPKDLKFPFLPFRLKNGKSVLTLCRKCSQQNNRQICKHSILERSLVSSYYINEIEYSLSLGYKILKIFESHYYKEEKFIFKDFVTRLNTLKIMNSNCLSKCSNITEKSEYCNFLNDNMNLKGNLKLTPYNVKYNPQNQFLYKLAANSLFGKLSQKNNFSKSIFISSQIELENKYFEHKNNIEQIICHDSICQMIVKTPENKLPSNKKANCYLGGRIVSYSRQEIYSHLQNLLQNSAKVFYIDTDAIFFSLPNNIPICLPISDAIGHFKHLYPGKITQFSCLGPKKYLISYINENKITEVVKVSGLSLKSFELQNKIDSGLYRCFIENYFKNKILKVPVKQKRKILNPQSQILTSNIQNVSFSNNVNIHRNFFLDDSFSSLPFGYQNN